MVDILRRNKVATAAEVSYSLETIYVQHHKSVYNYIAFRINNHHDAEELASDVFVKAMQRWDSYDADRPLEAWLIAIAKNIVTDYLRKTMRRGFAPIDAIAGMKSRDKRPEEIVVINENNRALMVALNRLRDKERQILSMKFATELKHEEIGQLLGISASQVGVVAHRAMGKMRKYMEEDEYDGYK